MKSVVGSLFLLLTCMLVSRADDDVVVPAALKDWQQWVLKDQEFRHCPLSFAQAGNEASQFVCTWYGELALRVDKQGAQFTLPIDVYRDGFVALPGDETVWPSAVKAQNNALAVVAKDGVPQVYLNAGHYQLAGEFHWRERPAEIAVPAALALVSLTLDGRPVSFVRHEGARVWLGASTEKKTEQDSLDVQVYRLIQDGLPMVSETRIRLTVTGRAREIAVGKALLDDFAPIELQSELASKLDNNGVLTVQVLPGDWEIHLRARATHIPTQLKRTDATAPWPGDEVWSFASDEALRAVSFEGGVPVDPQQVETPEEWLNFVTQRVASDSVIQVQERARGTQDKRNHLTWQRDLWLRFDGSRYSFVDQINGAMRDAWRLNVQDTVQLQSAQVDGEPQAISKDENNGAVGVELRDQQVTMRASGEIDNATAMPAAGWQHDFDGAQMKLHLPPGYRLFAASGVDSADGSIIAQWNLLDCFLLVLTCAVIFRLLSPIYAVLALFALGSLFHQALMPSWLLLNACAAVLIVRFADGHIKIWLQRYRNLSLALLLILALPFIAQQVRAILHPQLEERPYDYGGASFAKKPESDAAMLSAPGAMPASVPEYAMQSKKEATGRSNEIIEVTGSRPDSYDRYGQSTINQAGNGIPSWQWRSYQLNWQGPLTAEQTLNLYIVPRWLNALWMTAALFGFAWILWQLLRASTDMSLWQRWRQALVSMLAFVIVGGGLAPHDARADMPTADLLNDLRARLIAPPKCAPSCVDISDAQIDLDSNRLSISLTVHALFDSAVPLPGQSAEWTATTVLRDGTKASLHQHEGQWHIALPRGVHRVQMIGALAPRNRISVQFPALPRFVKVNASGWEVMGLDGNRLPSGALDLLRTASAGSANKIGENQIAITPFVRVHRHLYMGLDWSTETVIERVAPTQAAFSIAIPLADGEALSSAQWRVENGQVLLNFSAGEMEKRFQAKLPRVSQLQWQAPRTDLAWQWSLYPSAQWRVGFSGTPLIIQNDDPSVLHFVPREGETLALTITRPTLVEGNTVAYDHISLQENVGQRQRDGSLALNYRATQGGEQRLQLASDIDVRTVLSDGRPLMQRTQDGVLAFNVLPGEHQLQIDYERPLEIGLSTNLSAVMLPMAAANIDLSLTLPDDRWIVWTSGPLLGPVVLYWSALLVFIVLAWVIARARVTPLQFGAALLLGLGLSTVSWWVLAGLFGWLALVHRHGQRDIQHDESLSRFRYNIRQLFLITLSIAAVITLIYLVPRALLSSPDMMLSGNNSYGNQLAWFADFTDKAMPNVSVVSLPLWVYKGLMLLWAIWLSFALISWLRSAWQALNRNVFWRGKIIKTAIASNEAETKK